jgi:hypothetical protein
VIAITEDVHSGSYCKNLGIHGQKDSVNTTNFPKGHQMKKSILMLLAAGACFGQEKQPPIQNLNELVGMQVIVQRVPLCQPGTYSTVFTYAGKQAKVVSLKPSNITHLSDKTMSKLTPEVRSMIEDAQKSATILVEFEDGTRLDSCVAVSPNKLPDYFELAPGQIVEPAPKVASTSPAIAGSTVTAPTKPPAQATTEISNDEKQALNGSGRANTTKYEVGSLLGDRVQPDGTYSSNIYCGEGTVYTCTGSAGFNAFRIYDVETDEGTWHLVTDRQAGDVTVRQFGMTPTHLKSEKPNLLDSMKPGDRVAFRTEKDHRIGAKGSFHVFIPRADDPRKEEKFEGWFTPKNPPVQPPKPTDNVKAMCESHRFSPEDEKKYCSPSN